jgi:hypothetical protein
VPPRAEADRCENSPRPSPWPSPNRPPQSPRRPPALAVPTRLERGVPSRGRAAREIPPFIGYPPARGNTAYPTATAERQALAKKNSIVPRGPSGRASVSPGPLSSHTRMSTSRKISENFLAMFGAAPRCGEAFGGDSRRGALPRGGLMAQTKTGRRSPTRPIAAGTLHPAGHSLRSSSTTSAGSCTRSPRVVHNQTGPLPHTVGQGAQTR